MPSLSIILLNYRRVHDTLTCLASLTKSSYQDWTVIVVDNASNDGSVETLRNRHPRLEILSNDANLGFAGGNNVGIRRSLALGARYILLLNNDTVVHEKALEELVRTLEEHPEAGILGGKILYLDRPDTIWFAGGEFNTHSGFGRHIGIGKPDDGSYDVLGECDYITGCCLLARREVFQTAGLLDESFFAYLEDVDFCVRARGMGYKVLYQPKAVIYHNVSSTTSWDSPLYLYFNLRNKILFLRKHSRGMRWVPYLPKLVYFYLRQFIRLIVKWRNVPSARAAWWGLIDGLRGFTGISGMGRLPRLPGQP